MYGYDILCGISKGTFEIPHKISYPYIERCGFYSQVKRSPIPHHYGWTMGCLFWILQRKDTTRYWECIVWWLYPMRALYALLGLCAEKLQVWWIFVINKARLWRFLCYRMNALNPWRNGFNLKLVISKLISKIDVSIISCEITLRWMSQDLLMISQHWFKQWLGAVRQQTNIWANVDPDLCHQMSSLDHELHIGMHKHWALEFIF